MQINSSLRYNVHTSPSFVLLSSFPHKLKHTICICKSIFIRSYQGLLVSAGFYYGAVTVPLILLARHDQIAWPPYYSPSSLWKCRAAYSQHLGSSVSSKDVTPQTHPFLRLIPCWTYFFYHKTHQLTSHTNSPVRVQLPPFLHTELIPPKSDIITVMLPSYRTMVQGSPQRKIIYGLRKLGKDVELSLQLPITSPVQSPIYKLYPSFYTGNKHK